MTTVGTVLLLLAQGDASANIGILGLLSGAVSGGAIGAFTSYVTAVRQIQAERRRMLETWKEDWGVRQHAVYEEFFKHWTQKGHMEREEWENKYRKHLINFTSVFGSEEILDKAFAIADPSEVEDGAAIEELLRLAHRELFPREYTNDR